MDNWKPDHYFWIGFAESFSKRATCLRRKVGCVLVRDNQIISSGWNDATIGAPTCIDENECMMIDGGCKRTIHAEQMAIANAAKVETNTQGSIAYITLQPCLSCFKQLVSAGISEIYFSEPYRIQHSIEYASKINFPLHHLKQTV